MTSLRSIRLLALGLSIFLVFASACAQDGRLRRANLATLSDQDLAKLAKWDQARVTAITGELAPAISDIYVSVNTLKTGASVGSGQATAYLRLKDRVRVARNESRHLARQLTDGRGRLETVHSYSRLMTVIRDAREEARRMLIEKPTLDKIAVAGDLVRRLTPYYNPNWNQQTGE